ncbi:MAG TPA: hypothetical protein VEX39_05280 [Thermoleophilaceae bacterium]|nr:hypothetical protein [Thermoleophilaceae bacterium]
MGRTWLTVSGMVLGSVTMWIGNPAFWLWVTSRLQSTQARMGPYALMLAGVIGTAILCAKALGALDRRYERLNGTNVIYLHLPWARGLGGEHEKQLKPVTVLDVVMVLSVVVAVIAFSTWFVIVKPTPVGLEGSPSKD